MEEYIDPGFDPSGLLKIISSSKSGSKKQERLNDLRDRAFYLSEKSDSKPISWYEFKKTTPAKDAAPLRSFGIGAAIGLAVGGAVVAALTLAGFSVPVLYPLVISTVAAGATAAYSDIKNTPGADLIKSYEKYLNDFEKNSSCNHAYTIDKMPPLREGKNVEKLRETTLAQLQHPPIIHS